MYSSDTKTIKLSPPAFPQWAATRTIKNRSAGELFTTNSSRAAVLNKRAGSADFDVMGDIEDGLGGRVIGKPGRYGTAWLVDAQEDLPGFVGRISWDLSHRVRSGVLPMGDVVVKVQTVPGGQQPPVASWAHEAGVHAALSAATAAGCGSPISPAVPKFYASGYSAVSNCYVTVMDRAPGVPLESYMPKITAKAYVMIERAFASLWMCGCIHNDAHMNNVMIDPKTLGVTIIDFGLASWLPNHVTSKVASGVVTIVRQGAPCLAQVFDHVPDLKCMSNRNVYSRVKCSWYNPDYKTVINLYNKIDAAEKAKVPALRRAVWGCTASPSPPAPANHRTPKRALSPSSSGRASSNTTPTRPASANRSIAARPPKRALSPSSGRASSNTTPTRPASANRSIAARPPKRQAVMTKQQQQRLRVLAERANAQTQAQLAMAAKMQRAANARNRLTRERLEKEKKKKNAYDKVRAAAKALGRK